MMRLIPVMMALLAASPSHALEPRFPLKVAEGRRILVDQEGAPFLVVGDTAWSLIVQPREADIDHYLDDRRGRGFNSIIVNLIEHKFCATPPRTRAGLVPFKRSGDLSSPNPAYFDFAHRVVKKAGDHGILVWLTPAYLGAGGGDEGWFREIKAGGPATLRAYGRYVGKRFGDLPNVVWLLGGDFTPKKDDLWTVSELAKGIREADPAHLMSGHGTPGPSAVEAFGEPPWLTVNSAYSYDRDLFHPMLAAYHRKPVRPFVLIESVYEGEHDSRPEQIRRQAYWAMLSGGCGQFFGNNPIWHFDGPGLFPARMTWQEALAGTGSRDMGHLRDLFRDLPWTRLVPEEDHRIVVDGYGIGTATALTARTANHDLSITYVPSTGTEPRTLRIDLAEQSGPIKARWINPTNNRSTSVEDTRSSPGSIRSFRTPGDNGTGSNDWILILEAR
jgi:Protein of unknown function (DUF4038)/Putative collagen-binding domain of a collagenase